jgi:hypothetical protein
MQYMLFLLFIVIPTGAYAYDAVNLQVVDVTLTSIEIIAANVIGGLALLWTIRKLIDMMNRS